MAYVGQCAYQGAGSERALGEECVDPPPPISKLGNPLLRKVGSIPAYFGLRKHKKPCFRSERGPNG